MRVLPEPPRARALQNSRFFIPAPIPRARSAYVEPEFSMKIHSPKSEVLRIFQSATIKFLSTSFQITITSVGYDQKFWFDSFHQAPAITKGVGRLPTPFARRRLSPSEQADPCPKVHISSAGRASLLKRLSGSSGLGGCGTAQVQKIQSTRVIDAHE